MDQLDAILKFKNCYKELEEIDTENSPGDITKTKQLIAEKMYQIAQNLDVSTLIEKSTESPKFKVDICEFCNESILGVAVGTGTGYAHPDCYYGKSQKPNVPKPSGPLKKIKPHKIHNHPHWERSFDLVHNHVIIDREVYNQLLEKWDQVEKCL